MTHREPGTLPNFQAQAQALRVVVEGQRLTYGHLVNPTFATETAQIDPLPHQRLAVYHYLLPQPRLRFLLADDAGAGKTIMAGLYLREMLTRRLIRRVLIIPPAGLVTNWRRELDTLFSLSFRIITGSDARSANPFHGEESDLLIVSVDTLTGARLFGRLQEPATAPYDLVIFDEAHKLAADREPDGTLRKTERYKLAESLAGHRTDDPRWHLSWSAHHLLLLTATPHMGKDVPYYCLWRLLEPDLLLTMSAFHDYPPTARQHHFLRRTKEAMVRLDGSPLYPTRVTDTVSYALTQGDISEQTLYDHTTHYLEHGYNQARILNRSAARFAMSIFQRRFASSTYALLCSLERRLATLDGLIDDIRAGRLTEEHLRTAQRRLDDLTDLLDTTTADEEESEDGQEAHEVVEARALGGVTAVSLRDLDIERQHVAELRDLAHHVEQSGQESKFAKLRDLLRNPEYANVKAIIFTEHRDTLEFLARRLAGIGLTGRIAQLHGGMESSERDTQIAFFRTPIEEGGALYLVATDAAGEGINLQFCWLMINYDIPWNPARLEQRMGRIHRYGQQHDPVVILNLVAGKTREGMVMQVLLTKLERIRKELGSDKVFDVIGRLFEGETLTSYMQRVLHDADADQVAQQLAGRLTPEQTDALVAREQQLYGTDDDVKAHLPTVQAELEREVWRRVLPGYVRRFLEHALPLLELGIDGDLATGFTLTAQAPGALDPYLPLLEHYSPVQRAHLTITRPADRDAALFLRPGEPLFERLRDVVCGRFADDALRGAVLVDPTMTEPCFLHVALVRVERGADRTFPALSQSTTVEERLVALRQWQDGTIASCPVEYVLLLKGGTGIPPTAIDLVAQTRPRYDEADAYLAEQVAAPLAAEHRQRVQATVPERVALLKRAYAYQEAELAQARSKYMSKARSDPRARAELMNIKQRQSQLAGRREAAIALVEREPHLIRAGAVTFLAHALVVPTSAPDERERYDAAVEAIAMRVAQAYEEARGAVVQDVSTPAGARAANLDEYPGFDLFSRSPLGEERGIEVKGRAGSGQVEMTENEYAKACNLRERYWLYVVYDCASLRPRLLRVQDPFGALIVRAKGSVVIDQGAIVAAAEG